MRQVVLAISVLFQLGLVSSASAQTETFGSFPVLGICDCYEQQNGRTPWRSGNPYAQMYPSMRNCMTWGKGACNATCSDIVDARGMVDAIGTGKIACSKDPKDMKRLISLERLTTKQLVQLHGGERVPLRPFGVSGRQNGGIEHDIWPMAMMQTALAQAARELQKPPVQAGLVAVAVVGTVVVAILAPEVAAPVLLVRSATLAPTMGALTIFVFSTSKPVELNRIRTSQDVFDRFGTPDRVYSPRVLKP